MLSGLVYEWRRLWSVRATWIMSFVYLAITGLLGWSPLHLIDETQGMQTWKGLYSTSSNLLCLVMISVVSSQIFGHEYRYGLIRLTLSEFPAREKVLAAKTIMLGIYVTIMTFAGWAVLGLIGATSASGSISTDGPGFNINGGEPSELWQVLVYGLAYCVFAMSITILTRNLALGIIVPLILSSIVEGLVQVFNSLSKGKLDWIENSLPFANGSAWLTHLPDRPNAGLIFAAWIVGTYLVATLAFFKRDA